MLRIALILAALAASAPAQSFSKCKLSLHECAIVLEELEMMIRAEIRDDLLLTGLPVKVREERSIARIQGRTRQVFERQPTRIAGEVARMRVCLIKDDIAAIQGRVLSDPNCR